MTKDKPGHTSASNLEKARSADSRIMLSINREKDVTLDLLTDVTYEIAKLLNLDVSKEQLTT